jgi:hypothetical protein
MILIDGKNLADKREIAVVPTNALKAPSPRGEGWNEGKDD